MILMICIFVAGFAVGWVLRFWWTKWNYYQRSNYGPIRYLIGWKDR